MNENELFAEIERLNKEEKINIKQLGDEDFIKQKNSELYNTFKSYYTEKYDWNGFVREVLYEAPKLREYMYQRLLDLVLEHQRSPDDYFRMETKIGNYIIPNAIDKLNKLRILFKEYEEIYRKIKNRIHFDFPKEDYSGSLIRGNINWAKTLQNSNTKFPLTFFHQFKTKNLIHQEIFY